MNAALGAGSELLIDVAPGVDWTAAVAVVLGIQQVGAARIAVFACPEQCCRRPFCPCVCSTLSVPTKDPLYNV